jgi:hypothetical protein
VIGFLALFFVFIASARTRFVATSSICSGDSLSVIAVKSLIPEDMEDASKKLLQNPRKLQIRPTNLIKFGIRHTFPTKSNNSPKFDKRV